MRELVAADLNHLFPVAHALNMSKKECSTHMVTTKPSRKVLQAIGEAN